MATFQRARTQEQREVRRRSILATAAAMLGEMPVSAVSLNELSRRVGLAKSNVLRYFESREAILLDLLAAQTRDLLAELDDRLPARIDRAGAVGTRAEALASGLATSFASHEMLCELLGAQAGILERNISTEAAVRCRRETREVLADLAALSRRVLPELGDRQATEAAAMTLVLVAALWTHTRPAPAVRAACDADPSLAVLVPSFTAALERSLTVFFTGLLSDPSAVLGG
ncbi:TetR/AcrR family transcriptional regulator [Actinomadura sp. NEAU-AAG7]|uniref:TetR/AcrR family transcriptional regulator n=1 Tax=Actinomadura sp. NEAU-AAG7 TaxID=2839640 RepID=UPI001BE46BDC|nr:TetR/AcrR family transcriptional regulator [Actinomadura sp. NEAU-AAG7]MBT2211705.1 TetR/AcrR family transcriptional regulator [Actinomadura sp. NEAU-AAG7]